MGGKVWSKEEEDIFWLQLIPHSPKRLGADLDNDEQSWEWVARQMADIMGDGARRKYTHLCVCKYFYPVQPTQSRAAAMEVALSYH